MAPFRTGMLWHRLLTLPSRKSRRVPDIVWASALRLLEECKANRLPPLRKTLRLHRQLGKAKLPAWFPRRCLQQSGRSGPAPRTSVRSVPWSKAGG